MTIPLLLESRLKSAVAGFGELEPKVQPANDPRFGDYQTNAALLLARPARMNPRQLAERIVEKLDVGDMCEPPEIAGAGFINFRLKPEWLASRFAALAADPRLGVPAPAKPKKIVIDFSS
nr:arginine--tRNA ligase [Verrucomicrobiota bacterium]